MMSTNVLTLNIPDFLERELRLVNQEFLAEVLARGLQAVKIEHALQQYARGDISFGAAAHQAGVSLSELARHAYARGMDPPFSVETLAEELS